MKSRPGVPRDAARSVPVPPVQPDPAAPVRESGADGEPRRFTVLRVVLGGAVAGFSRALFDRLLSQLHF
ncbi:hypothetical protein AB0O01_17730 [Streptomyces sp. NPDC093252]|uniref:hypothetical protein n=1 Tax=Streptomyces sp. NPDC093252 TaxID=3154980 RepID=UPI0034391C9B